jgi:GNAT superfamily N-acetyltransferase
MLTYQRLNPSEPSDLADFQRVFRGTPSYTFATAGRPPTDAEVDAMMHTIPSGYGANDIFIYGISKEGELCGCSFTVRGYPKPESAYLVLLMIMESAQGKSLGTQALRHIEKEAKSWGCSSLAAVVDSQNERVLKIALREGFVEQYRKEGHGFMGQAVAIEKHGL